MNNKSKSNMIWISIIYKKEEIVKIMHKNISQNQITSKRIIISIVLTYKKLKKLL